MTRTAPRALSLQNYRENPRMRVVRDGASRAGKSRCARSVRHDLGPNIFPSGPPTQSISTFYYMTSSVSGQDEPNRALWLATRAGKMERYCPLGISRLVPQDQRSFFGVLSHIINPLLTKIVRSRWLDIGLVLFLRVYGPRLRLGP